MIIIVSHLEHIENLNKWDNHIRVNNGMIDIR